MAECTDFITFVHESTVQKSVKENDIKETCQNSPDKNTLDTTLQTSDDESVVTIGEIGIDEYFDDVYRGNNLNSSIIHDAPSDSEPSTSGPSTSNATNDTPNESTNALQSAVKSVHPNIVVEKRISFRQRE